MTESNTEIIVNESKSVQHKHSWTEENIISELKPIIKELGHFPTQKELNKLGETDLQGIIPRKGGYNYFREKMNYDLLKKPSGHWTEETIIKELEQIIDELGHFPTNKELNENGRGDISVAISRNGSTIYFREKMGYKLNVKPSGYWNEETIIKELEQIIKEIGHFPTHKELIKIRKGDLDAAIQNNGGFNYFKEKMGYEVTKKTNDYWNEKNTTKELEKLIEEIGHFPTHKKLIEIEKSSLMFGIQNNGGVNYFKEKMGYEITKKSPGYWNEKNIIEELNKIIKEIDHFPTQEELNESGKNSLVNGITKHGGIIYFRELMEYELERKPLNYWTEETIIKELEEVIKELDHFPTQEELTEIRRTDLSVAISRHNGIIHFRKLMGYELDAKPPGYWTEENIIKELEVIIKEIGHFPTSKELTKIGKSSLVSQIIRRNGFFHFRELMGYEFERKPNGYWTEETIIKELEEVINKLNYFPSNNDLIKIGKGDLSHSISRCGGVNYFREKLGFPPSETDPLKMSYIGKRGKKSEDFVEDLLNIWTEEHGKAPPEMNVTLGHGRLEFVFNYFGKRIGIDVTNTKGSKLNAFTTIKRKWRHRDYHLNLDELWIVVHTDALTSNDYDKLNRISPNNVQIFSGHGIINKLKIPEETCDLVKLEKLKGCEFSTKEKMTGLNQI